MLYKNKLSSSFRNMKAIDNFPMLTVLGIQTIGYGRNLESTRHI